VLSKKFSEAEVKDILENANSAPFKQRLNDNTKEALDTGAFGCPWHVVRNSKGESEPFFGSDRCVSLVLFFFLADARSAIFGWCNTFGYSSRRGRWLFETACEL
jgi:hypothetical protein